MLMFIFNKIESLSQQITTYHLQIPKIIAKKLCLDIMVRILWGNHLSFVFGLRCTSLSAFLWCVLSKAEYWEGQESDSIFNMYVGDAKNIVRIADTFFFCFFSDLGYLDNSWQLFPIEEAPSWQEEDFTVEAVTGLMNNPWLPLAKYDFGQRLYGRVSKLIAVGCHLKNSAIMGNHTVWIFLTYLSLPAHLSKITFIFEIWLNLEIFYWVLFFPFWPIVSLKDLFYSMPGTFLAVVASS